MYEMASMMISRWDNLPLCCSSGGSRDRSLSTSSLLRLPVLKCEMESAITITSMLLLCRGSRLGLRLVEVEM